MTNQEDWQQEEEISLFDLWETLREGKKIVFGGLLLGLLGAVLAIVLVPTKYEAEASIKIGTVAGNTIESAEVVVQRLLAPSFRMEIAQKLGDIALVGLLTTNAAGEKNMLKASVTKGTQLVDLTIYGKSQEQARKLGNLAIDALIERHDALGAITRKKITSDIAISKEKLKVVERELSELERAAIDVARIKDGQFAPASLIASLRVQKQSELFGLRQQITALELSLLPPATQPTQVIEELYVAQKPVSPKKGLLLVLGTIGGLLVGLIAVFISQAWRRGRAAAS